MESKTKITNARRRRNNNRHAGYYRSRNRTGTSYDRPVHVGFYLSSMLDEDGSVDRTKIVELFNSDSTFTRPADGKINSPAK